MWAAPAPAAPRPFKSPLSSRLADYLYAPNQKDLPTCSDVINPFATRRTIDSIGPAQAAICHRVIRKDREGASGEPPRQTDVASNESKQAHPAMNYITVFGGTGFLGRRVVRHIRASDAAVRSASRHPGRADRDDGVERIAADVHDERSIEAAVAGADGVVNAVSLYVERASTTFRSVHVEAAGRIASAARRAASNDWRSGRAGCLSGVDHRSPGGDVRTGRQLSHEDSRAASDAPGLSDVWCRPGGAPAGVCRRRRRGDLASLRQDETPHRIYELAARESIRTRSCCGPSPVGRDCGRY